MSSTGWKPLQSRSGRNWGLQFESLPWMDWLDWVDRMFEILWRRIEKENSGMSHSEINQQQNGLRWRFRIGWKLWRLRMSNFDSVVRLDFVFKVLRRRQPETSSRLQTRKTRGQRQSVFRRTGRDRKLQRKRMSEMDGLVGVDGMQRLLRRRIKDEDSRMFIRRWNFGPRWVGVSRRKSERDWRLQQRPVSDLHSLVGLVWVLFNLVNNWNLKDLWEIAY